MITKSPEFEKCGCEFTSFGTPWVAQRVCPIPKLPTGLICSETLAFKSATFPLVFESLISEPL